MRQISRAHLQLHNGELLDLVPPPAAQLELGATNHPAIQHRMRDVLARVAVETYRGRDGKPRPFEARHRELMWNLCAYADKYGEVHPHIVTLAGLADQLERDRANVRREVRHLEQAVLLWKRPVIDRYGRRHVIVIPGMIAPAR